MKENDVAFLGTLLGLDAEAVNGAVEDGTIGEKITALGLLNKTQVDTLKENYAKEVKDGHISELIEMAKQGNIPQGLYKPIHGAVLEKTEKALSKQYEITDYDGLEDLVGKAISKNNGQSDDKKLQELESLIEDLKGANKKLVTEKEEAVSDAESKLTTQLMTRDMDDHVSRVPFDFSDVEEDKMDEASKSRTEILKSVFASRYTTVYNEGKIIVQDKEGNVLKNQATLEPVPVADVLLDVSKSIGLKLISPESGGQGGSSSGKNGSRFKNVDEFYAHCRDKSINPTSDEGIKILKDSGLKLIP
jgi:hypothetical protein